MRSKGFGRMALGLGFVAAFGACSGGGGGDGPPISIGFESTGSTGAEGATESIVVTLVTTNGPLAADATITVSDTGAGSSTGGVDHDFTADRVVTFPAGSDNGDTQMVDVAVTLDQSVEGGDETLALTLSDPSTGVGMGMVNHTLTIPDADMADLVFVTPTSATVDESTAQNVEIELQLDPGETLGVAVQVTVQDGGGGTASSGVDYTAFVPTQLVFPAGSNDGDRLVVVLDPINDVMVEGDETAQLVFSNPSSGSQVIGTPDYHMVTITDDDLSGTAHLVVNGTPQGGPTAPVVNGNAYDLGSASLGSNGQTLSIVLSNAGAQAFDLSPLEMTGDTRDFAVDLQATTPSALPAPPVPAVFPFATTADDDVLGASLAFDAELASTLDGATEVVLDGVALPGGGELSLELERLPLPFTDDAVLKIDGVVADVAEATAGLTLWRGKVPDLDHSSAYLALSEAGSHGWVELGDGLGTLHLTTSYSPAEGGEPEMHWLWGSQLEGNYTGELPTCEAALIPPGGSLEAPVVPPTSSMTVGFTAPDCRLAVETDFQFYSIFGNSTAATQYATQMIAAVSDVFERDTQTTISIAYLGIYTSSNDPWSTPEAPGSGTGDLLTEFRTAWSGGGWPVAADLAHFVSGANLGGGVAYVGALCSQSFGFGVSANINGNINWGTFTGAPQASNWDFIVVAHELGHNFGSLHTHDYCPPLDECSANCNASSSCPSGTILSYCHLCGGMSNLRTEFHPHVAEVMRSNVAASCLGDATLAPGGTISLSVSFDPTSSTGGKAATLEFTHAAPNETSPFQIDLTGSATP